MACTHIFYVRTVRGTCGLQPFLRQGLHPLRHLLPSPDHLGVALNKSHAIAPLRDTRRHLGLEVTVARKHHHRVQVLQRHLQHLLQGFDVEPVLVQRVLKGDAVPVDGLRPFLLFF